MVRFPPKGTGFGNFWIRLTIPLVPFSFSLPCIKCNCICTTASKLANGKILEGVLQPPKYPPWVCTITAHNRSGIKSER